MSHTDSRTTTRELRAAIARHHANRMAEADRKNWGKMSSNKFFDRLDRRRHRYSAKRIIRETHGDLQP